MTGKQIVTSLMETAGMQNCTMASELGISQAAMWDRLNPMKTDNMTIKVLQEMASILGYEIAVVPKGAEIEGAYYVGDSYKREDKNA